MFRGGEGEGDGQLLVLSHAKRYDLLPLLLTMLSIRSALVRFVGRGFHGASKVVVVPSLLLRFGDLLLSLWTSRRRRRRGLFGRRSN